ncbi:MAG TPA: C13 family peptidase [Caulobacteraceae bacterium]|jgi:hypothetical protein|nr:C13 family peptidase [Caulobacteraceae bacterium]
MTRAPPAAVAGAWLALLAAPAWAQASDSPAPAPFADWAAVFVAGDYRGHEGGPSETFDNARRDLAEAFVASGFRRRNIQQFSVRPRLYPDSAPLPSELGLIKTELGRLAGQAMGGCLVYFTSHGSPDGTLVGNNLLTPQGAARLLGDTCGDRPTVVVISACYSGVFVPALAGPNRMVLTAARPDRSSFGCGESDRYPYFDACVLETLPEAGDFAVMGRGAQACVQRKEAEAKVGPPSEPQMALGGGIRPLLPLLTLHQR